MGIVGNRSSKHVKKAFMYIKSTNKSINTEDKEIADEIEHKNHSLLYYVYKKNGNKAKALEILHRARSSKLGIAQLKEIVYTHIYFDDIEGALNYIKSYDNKVAELIPLESLINIHLIIRNMKEPTTDIENDVFAHILKGINAFYDRNLIEILKNFYSISTDKSSFKNKFKEIQEIILNRYYTKLTYKEAKYLYKTMPGKFVFLKKMIELNPFIKRKYYLQYANIAGIHKTDIMRILTTKYRPWAMAIALLYNWVDESMRIPFEKERKMSPRLLNESGDWKWDFSKVMCFAKKYNKNL